MFKKKIFPEEITYSGSAGFLLQPGRGPLCHAT